VELDHRDFVAALSEDAIEADIAWIGLSLHHLHTPQKLALMRAIRRAVGSRGQLPIYENASPVEETREEWLERWDAQRPAWTAQRRRVAVDRPSCARLRLPRDRCRVA
jgi:hypothetical protein